MTIFHPTRRGGMQHVTDQAVTDARTTIVSARSVSDQNMLKGIVEEY